MGLSCPENLLTSLEAGEHIWKIDQNLPLRDVFSENERNIFQKRMFSSEKITAFLFCFQNSINLRYKTSNHNRYE